MKEQEYDLIIIGSGPAGLAAGIYAARYKMNFLVIGKSPGGTMADSYDIENYPGFENVIPGHELSDKMVKQLRRLGHEVKIDSIREIKKKKDQFLMSGNTGAYTAKKILLALGMEKVKLNIPGEAELEGKGVSYCATCDGYFYKEKSVAVVGGGDSAAKAALHLSDITKKVYMIVRRDALRAEPAWQESIKKAKNIEVIYEANIKEIKGTDKVESVVLDKKDRELKVDGVFIEIGQTPQSDIIKQVNVKTDEKGLIVTAPNQKTSARSVWAAGDITTGSNKLRQITTACAEGAVAAVDIFTELKKEK